MKSRTAIIGAGLTGLSCARVLRRAGPYVELFEADHIIGVRMAPCWSLMVRLDDRSLPDADVYSDMSDVMSWVARDSTKPGRNTRGETIFVQAS